MNKITSTYHKRSTRSGFSLVELIVTIGIIGILAVIAIPNFKNAKVRTDIVKTYSNFRALSYSISHYQIDQGKLIPYNPIRGRSFLYLTSPIIYLSDLEVASDPFSKTVVNQEGAVVKNPNAYFDYIPFRNHYLSAFFEQDRAKHRSDPLLVNIAGKQLRNPGFALQSIGPSKHFGPRTFLIDKTYQIPNVYSPSNGLYSTGSLIAIDGAIYN